MSTLSTLRQLTNFAAASLMAALLSTASYAAEADGVAIPEGGVSAESVTGSSRTCPNAKLFSQKLISDICWECLFPVRMAGTKTGGGQVPKEAQTGVFCACDDPLGIPQPGMNVGYWEAARIIELVREPGCAPALGGVTLPGSNRLAQGTQGIGYKDATDLSFYHYRYYAFPLFLMLDLFMPDGCFSDGMVDFDIMYISELDPTWNDDQLAFFTNPEAAAVANLPAQAACVADAVHTATGETNDVFWWCAGSWGSMYPMSGHAGNAGFVSNTSLASARAIGALHRRGLALRTMGKSAMCKAVIEPMVPKSQYKMSMFFPVAEAKTAHVIGETVVKWGSARMIPAYGEDAVYVVWRWNDCCMLY